MIDFGIMELHLKLHGFKGYNKILMQGGKLYENACSEAWGVLPFYPTVVIWHKFDSVTQPISFLSISSELLAKLQIRFY